MTTPRRATAALILVGLLVPAAASGAAWTPAARLSGSGVLAATPQVAVDPRGRATALWSQTGAGVLGSTSLAGGPWSPGAPPFASRADAERPQVGVDAAGTLTAVWLEEGEILTAARRAGDGAWTTPIVLSGGPSAYDLDLAVGADGTAAAVWSQPGLGVQAIVRRPGEAWGESADPSFGSPGVMDPRAAVGADGTVVVAWRAFVDPGVEVDAAVARPTGGWFAPSRVAAPVEQGFELTSADVAVGPQGEAVAVWTRFDGATDRAQAATRPPGGTWGTPVDLSTPGLEAQSSAVVVAAGAPLAAWVVQTSNGEYRLQSASSDTGSAFGPPVDVSDPEADARGLVLAASPVAQQPLLLAWQGSDGAQRRIRAAVRRGGGWSSVATLSPAGSDAFTPAAAVGDTGEAAVVWARRTAGAGLIEAASLIGAGEPAARIGSLRLSRTRVAAGDPLTARFTLDRPAQVAVEVRRLVIGAKGVRTWRRRVERRFHAAGLVAVAVPTSGLAAGGYQLAVSVVGGGGAGASFGVRR